jgi:hypothetical protein
MMKTKIPFITETANGNKLWKGDLARGLYAFKLCWAYRTYPSGRMQFHGLRFARSFQAGWISKAASAENDRRSAFEDNGMNDAQGSPL